MSMIRRLKRAAKHNARAGKNIRHDRWMRALRRHVAGRRCRCELCEGRA